MSNKIKLLLCCLLTLTCTGCNKSPSPTQQMKEIEQLPQISAITQQSVTDDITHDDFILPIGLETKQDVIDWAKLNNIIETTDNMDKKLNVSDYVDLMYYMVSNNQMPQLKNEVTLPKSISSQDKYIELNKKGYLSLFSEEEIADNVPLTLNHFTRIMSSVMDYYKPYEEVDADTEKFYLDQVDNVSVEDSECRKKKVIHLLQLSLLPTTYKDEYPMDRQLSKYDFAVLSVNLLDTMRLNTPQADAEGCLPCQKENIRNERSVNR